MKTFLHLSNPKLQRPLWKGILFTGLLGLFGVGTPSTDAQVNDRRVLRDATGVYRGQSTGGEIAVTYDDGAPGFTMGVENRSGKVRVPVKKGRTKSRMRHPDMPSDEGFDYNGVAVGQARQKPKVTRGGRRVSTRVMGASVRLDDDPRKGPWTQGKCAGNFDKRGKKWNAVARNGSSAQRNSRVLGEPADHTKRITGLMVKGRG